MPEPAEIDVGRFFEFIGGPGPKVVLVSVHGSHVFSGALAERLAIVHADIACGRVPLVELIVRGASALRFLHQGMRACGAPATFGVLPGYCFFRDADMLAWDAGLPALDDLGPLVRSAAFGAAVSGLTGDAAFIGTAWRTALEHLAAWRVAHRFRLASARHDDRASAPREAPRGDELYWAYQLLGVLPTASDREVHDAWRRRRMEHHPDHATADPAEFERRSRLSADINRARDVIVAARLGRAA